MLCCSPMWYSLAILTSGCSKFLPAPLFTRSASGSQHTFQFRQAHSSCHQLQAFALQLSRQVEGGRHLQASHESCAMSHVSCVMTCGTAECVACGCADKLRKAGSSRSKGGGNSFKESNVEKGMVLPFTPLTMTFHDVHYFVDCPPVRV